MATFDEVVSRAESMGLGVRRSSDGYVCCCPSHDDSRPSLSIREGDNGQVLLRCFSDENCTFESILKAMDLYGKGGNKIERRRSKTTKKRENKRGPHVRDYDYYDIDGNLVFQSRRFKDPKEFSFRAPKPTLGNKADPNKDDDWIYSSKGIKQIPYMVQHWYQSDRKKNYLFLVEGEKDVETMIDRGFDATCVCGGSKQYRRLEEPAFEEHLRGRKVVIIHDCDEPGINFAKKAKEIIKRYAWKVGILRLPEFEILKKGGSDVTDWFDLGLGNEDRLLELALEAIEGKQLLYIEQTQKETMRELVTREEAGWESVPTGIQLLDAKLGGGIARGGTTLLTAAPGFGKTSFGLSVCLDWTARWRENAGLFWSLELGRIDAHCRLITIASDAKLAWHQVRSGRNNDCARYAFEKIRGQLLSIMDRHQLKQDQFEEVIVNTKKRFGKAPFVVIDFAQLLINPLANEDARIAGKLVSNWLVNIASKHGVPMLLLCSTPRGCYTLDWREHPSNFLATAKETSEFESECMSAIHIAPKNKKSEADSFDEAVFVIAKNRVGNGIGKVHVRFDGQSGRWYQDENQDQQKSKAISVEVPLDFKLKVFDAVTGHNCEKINDIYELIGGNKSKFSTHFATLRRAKDIFKDEKGYWRKTTQ